MMTTMMMMVMVAVSSYWVFARAGNWALCSLQLLIRTRQGKYWSEFLDEERGHRWSSEPDTALGSAVIIQFSGGRLILREGWLGRGVAEDVAGGDPSAEPLSLVEATLDNEKGCRLCFVLFCLV